MEATKTKSFALEYQIEVLIQTVKISSSSLRSFPSHASCSCCHVFTSVARNSNQIVAMHKSDLACPTKTSGFTLTQAGKRQEHSTLSRGVKQRTSERDRVVILKKEKREAARNVTRREIHALSSLLLDSLALLLRFVCGSSEIRLQRSNFVVSHLNPLAAPAARQDHFLFPFLSNDSRVSGACRRVYDGRGGETRMQRTFSH